MLRDRDSLVLTMVEAYAVLIGGLRVLTAAQSLGLQARSLGSSLEQRYEALVLKAVPAATSATISCVLLSCS